MDSSQRRAAGKLTVREATEFIERLQDEEYRREADEASPSEPAVDVSSGELALREYSDHHLAAEVQRRGWVVER